MKKIYLLLFLASCSSMVTLSANAWETNAKSNITIECINENLDPCSSLETSSNKSNQNFDLDIDKAAKKKKVVKKKVTKKKKKVVKKKITKKKKKVAKKKVTKKKKKVAKKKTAKKKKKKKDIFLKTSSNKSNTNFDFDRDISFEEFKVLLINYTNNSDYPNIDN